VVGEVCDDERLVQPAECVEARLLVQGVVELVGIQPASEEIEDRARVERPRTRDHRHALERGQAHRRVDRAAVLDRGHRAPASEVADDKTRRAHLLDDRLHCEPVEAVPDDAAFCAPMLRHGVQACLVRHRRMEVGVRHRDVGDFRKRLARAGDRLEGGPVVEWGNRCALLDVLEHGVVDRGRLRHEPPEVDDPVADRVAAHVERFHRSRLLARDEMQLQARRAGIDD
jgi:hypothetical protein